MDKDPPIDDVKKGDTDENESKTETPKKVPAKRGRKPKVPKHIPPIEEASKEEADEADEDKTVTGRKTRRSTRRSESSEILVATPEKGTLPSPEKSVSSPEKSPCLKLKQVEVSLRAMPAKELESLTKHEEVNQLKTEGQAEVKSLPDKSPEKSRRGRKAKAKLLEAEPTNKLDVTEQSPEKSDQSKESEKSDVSEKSEAFEKSDMSEISEKSKKLDKLDKIKKSDKSRRSDDIS